MLLVILFGRRRRRHRQLVPDSAGVAAFVQEQGRFICRRRRYPRFRRLLHCRFGGGGSQQLGEQKQLTSSLHWHLVGLLLLLAEMLVKVEALMLMEQDVELVVVVAVPVVMPVVVIQLLLLVLPLLLLLRPY